MLKINSRSTYARRVFPRLSYIPRQQRSNYWNNAQLGYTSLSKPPLDDITFNNKTKDIQNRLQNFYWVDFSDVG